MPNKEIDELVALKCNNLLESFTKDSLLDKAESVTSTIVTLYLYLREYGFSESDITELIKKSKNDILGRK